MFNYLFHFFKYEINHINPLQLFFTKYIIRLYSKNKKIILEIYYTIIFQKIKEYFSKLIFYYFNLYNFVLLLIICNINILKDVYTTIEYFSNISKNITISFVVTIVQYQKEICQDKNLTPSLNNFYH